MNRTPQIVWKFIPNVYIATLIKKEIFDENIFSPHEITFHQSSLGIVTCVHPNLATKTQAQIVEGLFKVRRNSFYCLLNGVTFTPKEVHISSTIQWNAYHMKIVEQAFKSAVRGIEIIQIFD
jgi:hypothetical protein